MSYIPLIKRVGAEGQSSFRKYQDLFVGSRSLAELVRYELILSALGSRPGALGIYLRSKAYPRLFKKCGKNVFFGRGVTIRVPGRIELGANVIVDDHAVLDAKGDPKASFISCGNEVEIGRNSILSCKDVGSIWLGNFVSIGRNVLLSSISELVVGDNCSVGPYSCLLASGHGWDDPRKPVMLQNREIKKIVIEKNVWLGAHVVVMDGVTIGENSIIAAGSVVTQDIPPYRIAAGIPARVIAKRDSIDAEGDDGNQICVPMQDQSTGSRILQRRAKGARMEQSVDLFPRVTQAVFGAIDEINQRLPKDHRLERSTTTTLFNGSVGNAGNLDSLGLLNLIVATEQRIESEFGITITLADERAMSQKNSPFRTIGTLANYVSLLLEEKVNA
jgi:acetyltransferase-like isoleucine patch superfamily enzyme/acyl carrier protein